MKNLYSFIVLLFALNISSAISQDNTWFKDITIQAGLEGLKTTYVQSADVNGDFFPDILIGTSGILVGHSQTFSLFLNVEDTENPGQRKFVDFTAESGINVSRIPGKPMREYDMAILGDVDNDGDVDVVSSMYYHRLEYVTNPDTLDKSEVFLNDGTGHFTMKADAGLADYVFFTGLTPGLIDAVGLSFIDYDFDGILDLYIATKFKDYLYGVNFPDILMKGNGDGSFTEVKNAGVQAITEPLYGVNVTDYDNDGWQDVITSPYCRTGGRIMRNMGNGLFLDVAQGVGYSAQNYGGDAGYDQNGNWVQQPLCQWEAPTADFDNDGDMDILQCLIHGGLQVHSNGTIEGHTHIAINQGPPDYNFEDALNIIHRNEDIASHLGDYSGLWVDFDNNGWQDVVVCQGYYTPATDRIYMCIQKDDHEFYDITQDLGLMYIKDASNAESSDFDLDGDNDIFVFHSKDTPQLRLLRNDIANNSNWISVKLTPPAGCNQSAIGARVTVHSDTLNQIREIQTGLGHFGDQQPFILNFGLAELNRVDSITIRWPMMYSPITKIYNPPTNINIIADSLGNIDYIKTWEGQKAIVKFMQTYTDFGQLNVGDSLDMAFEITNVGDTTLNVSDYLIEKDAYSVYQILEKAVPFSLEPLETKEIKVRFKPNLREKYKSIVTFVSNAVNDQTKAYDIIGQGYKPEALIALNKKELRYDSTKTSSTQTLTITNPGDLDLVVDEITFPGDSNSVFSIAELNNNSLQLPITIPSQENRILTVVFEPKQRINYSAELKIHSNAYKDTNVIVSLYGIGDAPTPYIRISNLFINFKTVPVNSYYDVAIKIENNGDGVLHISGISIEDNSDNAFSFPGISYPVSVNGNDFREIEMRFEPKEQISFNRKVYIYSDAINEPVKQLNARGTGGEPIFVEEQKFDNENISIRISPNPFIDKLKINYELLNGFSEIPEIYLTGLQGNTIFKFTDIEINREFDLSHLPVAVYFLVIKTKGKITTIPLIKM
ncbi:MAG: choice-of-anchor D domain-containing protein [bacterium]